jgi:hypothetical protein
MGGNLMAFDFRIVFSGICAFVPSPNGSFDDLTKKTGFFNSVNVVLPDMISAQALSKDDVREGHLPTLELDRSHGWKGDRDPDLVAPKRADRRDIYLLGKERVSFEFEGGTPGGIEVHNFETPPEHTAPAEGEETFFWWVPKMERVVEGSHLLSDKFLTEKLVDGVSTLVKVKQGLLSVPPGSISTREIEFLPIDGKGGGIHQRIAFRIALEVKQVTSVKIDFQTQLPDGSEETRTLSLAGAEGLIEIAIKNREVEDLLGLKPKPKQASKGDVDFHAYYDLSSDGAAAQPLVPFDVKLPGGIGDVSFKIGGVCPPAAFSGVAAAADGQVAPASLEASAEEETIEDKAA